jgi:xanthine dehydrogenase accessory factor
MSRDLSILARELTERGEPFAVATVVRAESPTSARPGARALVRADGSIVGWIGGSCAQPVVQREAAAALDDGRPRLIAIVGTSGGRRARIPGLVEHTSTCYSGGTMEIYVEPVLPKPLLVIVGESPVADALEKMAAALDFRVVPVASDDVAGGFSKATIAASSYVVIATHGMADEEAVARALATPAGYVSLVASRKRADAVLDHVRQRGVSDEQLARIKAPAGLEIGAETLEEVAVSILAEIVSVRRAAYPRTLASSHPEALAPSDPGTPAPSSAIDPICGMTVQIAGARFRSDALGRPVYFCCEGCRSTFERDPARYASVVS